MDHGGSNQLHRAVHDKRPVPEIDFTLHTMEDGAQVSTQERVCKGIQVETLVKKETDRRLIRLRRRPSTRIGSAHGRSVPLSI